MVPFPEQFSLQSRNFLLPELFLCFLPVFQMSLTVQMCFTHLPVIPCMDCWASKPLSVISHHILIFQLLLPSPHTQTHPTLPTASSPVLLCWTPCSSCPSHCVTGMSREFCGMRLSIPYEGECRGCWKLSHFAFIPFPAALRVVPGTEGNLDTTSKGVQDKEEWF